MPRCGNCKQNHPTVQDVKDCFAGGKPGQQSELLPAGHTLPAFATDPATDKQIKFVNDLLVLKDTEGLGKMPDDWRVVETMMDVMDGKAVSKAEISALINSLTSCPNKSLPEDAIPEGKYAVEGQDGIVQFWEVSKPQHGKWAGRTFANMLVGSPGAWRSIRTPRITSVHVIEQIAADPAAAARLFGIKTRTCGRCGSPLSHICSRAAGYGKHCANIVGWSYPSKQEAVRILDERGEDYSDVSNTPEEDECSGGTCKSIDELCSHHQMKYQMKYGRASNE